MHERFANLEKIFFTDREPFCIASDSYPGSPIQSTRKSS